MDTTVENNPLISIYLSLDASDSRRLTKWLDSPAHNQREDVRALHAYLTGGKDRLNRTPALSKMRIWTQLFPQEPFDDARLRQTFHWALKATEGFLAYVNWQNDEFSQHLALIEELRQRDIPGFSTKKLKKAINNQLQIPLRNEKYFRNEYLLELEREEHRNLYDPQTVPRLQEISNTLDLTYFIEKLKVAGNTIFQQRVKKTSYDLRLVDVVLDQVSQLDLTKYPVLSIHYYGYRGLTENDENGKIIGLLRTTVGQHSDMLSRSDLRYFILMAINLCISNANKGLDLFIREAFEWYKLGLETESMIQNNLLTRETYLNVVLNALKLQEYDWVRSFMDSYSDKLESSIRENTERFARARLSYKLQDYTTAMQLLILVDFKHHVYNLVAKTLLLKIYFELGEMDALDSQLDSMTTYIRRKELSDLHQKTFKNILRYVRQLSRIPPTHQKATLLKLRQQVEATTPLIEKEWLLQQIDGKLKR
jgi:hypothetical protein